MDSSERRTLGSEITPFRAPWFSKVLLVALVYFLSAKISIYIGAPDGVGASPIWPPAGIALAALLLWGGKLWPGIFIGSFVTEYIVTQENFIAALGISIGCTLEAFLGAHYLNKVNFDKSFKKTKAVLNFVVIAALLSPAISATSGIIINSYIGLAQWEQFSANWLTWWIGDMMGNLIVAPFILVWCSQITRSGLTTWQIVERFGAVLVLTIFLFFIFSVPEPQSVNHIYFRSYSLFPPLLWITYRYSPRGYLTAILYISIVSIWNTINDGVPLEGSDVFNNLFELQVFLAGIAFTFLLFGAVVQERAQSEQRIKGTLKDLERAVKDREDIVAIVSHDLKGPLCSVLLNSQMLHDAVTRQASEIDPKNIVLQSKRIQNGANQMNRLIENILDVTKLESGTFTIEPKSEDAKTIIKKAIELFQPLANEKSIKLVTQVNPPCNAVHCDHERILQVLSNLISNAIKFTPENGTIQIGLSEQPGFAHFTVQDTGPGIPTEHLPFIFDRFWQAKASSKQGIGMGLAIADGIIKGHKGRIWVESEFGKGCAFHFTLPISN